MSRFYSLANLFLTQPPTIHRVLFWWFPSVAVNTVRGDHPLSVAYQQARCNPSSMIADVVSDMPGNHRSLRLRRDACRVTTPVRTASLRERLPVFSGDRKSVV